MVSRPVVQVVIGVAALLWGLLLTLQGVAVELAWLRWYSLVVGVVVLLLLAFDRWIWRLLAGRTLFTYLVRVPDISGTWKGELGSSWIDPDTGAGVPPIPVFLVVRQTYSSIAVTMLTPEAKSYSLAARVEPINGDEAVLSYTYTNTPRLLIQDRSRIHHGTAFLEVHGSKPQALIGSYWTDRDTKGEMAFRMRVRKSHTEFAEAQAAFE